MLAADLATSWQEDGFLILPGFYDDGEIRALTGVVDRVWAERPSSVVVDDLVTGRRCRISDLSAEELTHSFKVNDLYLEYDEMRDVILRDDVARLLHDLLGDPPVLCNTLNLTRGSQQEDHVDALYMTPATPGSLAATWIALEDCHPDAGPLRYFPGSHRIPLYRFSDGGHHTIPDEMDAWRRYIASAIAERGLKPQYFEARRGDVFVWHANLLHGGGEIHDPTRTRNSLVSHFWTLADCRAGGADAVPLGEGYWLRRPPQAVPEVPAGDAGAAGRASLGGVVRGALSRLRAGRGRP